MIPGINAAGGPGGGGGFQGSSSASASSANQIDNHHAQGLNFGHYGTGSQLLSDWKSLAIVGTVVVLGIAAFRKRGK